MSTGGFSAARLERLHATMAGYVERGATPGIVTLVSRRGETLVDTIGSMSLGGSEPIARDTLFRIFSLTKPIVAVATMILVEECRLRLDDPVDPYLPELAGRSVLKRLDAPLDDTVPAHRPITVRDLLSFRNGFGILLASPDEYPILRAAENLQLMIGPPLPFTPHSPDEWLRRLGTLPLMHQPGEQWMYNTGSDILGVLIARVTGQPLETFLRERIFDPLGMRDTAFSVPPDKLKRLATSYMIDNETGVLDLYDGVEDSAWSHPPTFPAGRGGLVSTIDDYHAFGQMLLNNGTYKHQRILSRSAVAAMTTDQLTAQQKAASSTVPIFLGNRGWGFGMSVITQRDGVAASPGRFGWDGGLCASWYADPSEDLLAIVMSQQLASYPLIDDFWTSVYQAIDD